MMAFSALSTVTFHESRYCLLSIASWTKVSSSPGSLTKAVLLNVVSLGSAFGVHGQFWQRGLRLGTHFRSTATVRYAVGFRSLWALQFGLTMDYDVLYIQDAEKSKTVSIRGRGRVRRSHAKRDDCNIGSCSSK